MELKVEETPYFWREGIWYVKEIKNGQHKRFVGDKVSDLPDIIKRAELEPYRGAISDTIRRYIESRKVMSGFNTFRDVKVKEIVDLIFSVIKEK